MKFLLSSHPHHDSNLETTSGDQETTSALISSAATAIRKPHQDIRESLQDQDDDVHCAMVCAFASCSVAFPIRNLFLLFVAGANLAEYPPAPLGHQAVELNVRIKESKELRSCILESKESSRSLKFSNLRILLAC